MQKRLLVALIVISIFSLVVTAQVAQPEPMPGTYVHDFAGVIPEDKKAEIQGKAQRLKDEYKTEIALVTIESLQGEDSFDYSMRMARSWGIGSPDNEVRGLLILVAVKDRKTSFRTSRHIEGEIPDAVTNDVSQAMNAYFKRGDFGGGLSAGMDKILARLQTISDPSATPPATPPQEESSGWIRFWLILWGGVAVLIIIDAVRKRRRGRQRQEAAARQKPSRSNKRRPANHSKAAKSKRANSPSRPSEASTFSSDYSSSSSSSWSSSSSSDSGSSYSGGSDFGGGGSDSSW